ncbi:MAG: hypothetical protein KME11_09560 [Timaviella obliquedivisa GSE-PSE-MK23-08B]|jgi:hypothetical protein|nr:hypothetical protein [Timaviella obliquedivisa GSE-PSE-MK23-08B]
MQAGPSFLSTFIYYFSTTAIVLTIVVSRATGLQIATGIPQQIGALGGALAGLVGVYFNRSVAIALPFAEKKKFLVELETLLTAMGYQLQEEGDEVRVYARSGINKWLSGRVFVKFEGQEATIASRAVHMRQIEPQIQANRLSDRAAALKRSCKNLD